MQDSEVGRGNGSDDDAGEQTAPAELVIERAAAAAEGVGDEVHGGEVGAGDDRERAGKERGGVGPS